MERGNKTLRIDVSSNVGGFSVSTLYSVMSKSHNFKENFLFIEIREHRKALAKLKATGEK